MKELDQQLLYSKEPKLSEIYKLSFFECLETVKINVWRNFGVENISKTINFYSNQYNLKIDWNFNFYDVSLNFVSRTSADIDLLMIDCDEYGNDVLFDLLNQKLIELKQLGSNCALILFSKTNNNSIQELTQNLRNSQKITIINIDEISYLQGTELVDKRLLGLTGSWISIKALPIIAREIFHQVILKFIKQPIKILALDLDNTLYDGVLLEDGIEKINHNKFQIILIDFIKKLKDKGIIVACVSRNELNDFENLILTNKNIKLEKDFFDFVFISWKPKKQMIKELLERTNLGEESLIYIDDNITELFLMNESFPKSHFIIANNGESTILKLELLSHLILEGNIKENAIRVLDLKSNENRENVFNQFGIEKAKEVLNVELDFYVNKIEHFNRCSELSLKTNQFNFNFSRYSQHQVNDFAKNNYIISVNLKDKFADSGLIAALFIQQSDHELIVEEFCISCRALGRGLESEIFYTGLKQVLNSTAKSIKLKFKKGPRNMPCLEWLKELDAINRVDYFELDTQIIREWSVANYATLKS